MAFLSSDISSKMTAEVIESLNKAEIWTVNDFLSLELMDIRHKTDIKYGDLKEIAEKIRKRYTLPCNDMAFWLGKAMQECKMCPTGLPELTLALDGGFQTQEIVEFFGESECGKTEMCYLLCGNILSHFEDHQILYIASNFDFNHEKVSKYIKSKSGGMIVSEDDLFKCLNRVEIARPTKVNELVHLLNTLVHQDRKNLIKCVIIDSLSMIVQEDLLSIKTTNLDDADELEQVSALKSIQILTTENNLSKEKTKKELVDIYIHEIMRLLTTVAITKNVIVVLTNSNQSLVDSQSYTNAIDHRIHLAKMPEFSRYQVSNPTSSVCRATILKTIHNITKVGYTIPFAINDEGLFALRLTSNLESELKELEEEIK